MINDIANGTDYEQVPRFPREKSIKEVKLQ